MGPVRLDDRQVLAMSGADATKLLSDLVTGHVDDLADNGISAAALLAPQGKILFDMLVVRSGDGFLIDCLAEHRDALAKRLGFYKLRSDVTITPRDDLAVLWSKEQPEDALTWSADPRLPGLGWRAYADGGAADSDARAFHAVRIALGVAECGHDFATQTTFPHEANHDLLGGIAFEKGCFVGQEVVSRMQHRGTARKRFVPCSVDRDPPPAGTEIMAGERAAGVTGSSAGGVQLALLRLERALAAGVTLSADGATLTPQVPSWMPISEEQEAS